MSDAGDVFSLLYLSQSTIPFSKQDLRELLTKSRENNSQLGITGMLLFKGGNFLQVLEGRQETVMSLYERISRDSRHSQSQLCFKALHRREIFPIGQWVFTT
jgi:Sensors of blue-light using FAD